MEGVQLYGAEDVRRAGTSIASAAQDITRAVSYYSETSVALTHLLSDTTHAMRELTLAINRLNDNMEKKGQ